MDGPVPTRRRKNVVTRHRSRIKPLSLPAAVAAARMTAPDRLLHIRHLSRPRQSRALRLHVRYTHTSPTGAACAEGRLNTYIRVTSPPWSPKQRVAAEASVPRTRCMAQVRMQTPMFSKRYSLADFTRMWAGRKRRRSNCQWMIEKTLHNERMHLNTQIS